MSRTRVVVTGIGATTPLGGDAPSTWEALLAGRSGVRVLDRGLGGRPAGQDRRPGRRRPGRGAGPGRGPADGPVRPVGGDRRAGGLERRRLRPQGGQPGRPGPARRRHRDRDRRPEHPAQQLGHPEGEGPARGEPAGHPDADGQLLGRQRQHPARSPGRRARAGVGLRVQQRVDLARAGHDPARPGRRGGGRRHRGLRPPAADRLLRPDAGDEPPQRRARTRVAALGRRPRRLRARRGRGGVRDRAARARAGPGRADLGRAGRRRHHRRLRTTWSSPTRPARRRPRP